MVTGWGPCSGSRWDGTLVVDGDGMGPWQWMVMGWVPASGWRWDGTLAVGGDDMGHCQVGNNRCLASPSPSRGAFADTISKRS